MLIRTFFVSQVNALLITNSTLPPFENSGHRKFYNYKRYKYIKPDSNEPVSLCGTAKTHNFDNLDDITVANLKFRPIIDQAGTLTCNAAKVISNYSRPLCKNEYSINDTQEFRSMLSSIPFSQDDEKAVSYDVES